MGVCMKHIIWDFNGTLLGDAQLSVDVDNAVFDRLGLPRITLDTCLSLIHI